MARFKWMGDSGSAFAGTCTKIHARKEDGSFATYLPVDPATEFAVGEDVGYDITDPATLAEWRGSGRFEEI